MPSDLYQSLNQTELSEKVGLPLPFGGGFIPQGAWLAPRQLVQHAFAFLEKQGVQIKTITKSNRTFRKQKMVGKSLQLKIKLSAMKWLF